MRGELGGQIVLVFPLILFFSVKTLHWLKMFQSEARGSKLWFRFSRPSERSHHRQVCVSADLTGPQPQTCLIFRGAGCVSEVEKIAYDPDVHVLWQKKGWLDRETAVDWVNDVWAPFVKHNFTNKVFQVNRSPANLSTND